MKKHMAMKLVKALRSGEYEQGRRSLVDDQDRFCCLGVACNISEVELDWTFHQVYGEWGIGGEQGVLPEQVQKEFGFATIEGHRKNLKQLKINGRTYDSLASANDEGVSFSDIADYIEQHYKEL